MSDTPEYWIEWFENQSLRSNGTNNGFYVDGKAGAYQLNIGYGFNITGNLSTARATLAAVGVTFTNAQWTTVLQYATHPTKTSATTLQKLVNTRITQSEANQLVVNRLTSVVVPGLTKKIPNFADLPSLTQAALDNVYYDHSTLLGTLTYTAAKNDNLVGVAEQLAFNADNQDASSANVGLELRFLTDGLLALGVVPTLNGNNQVTTIDASGAVTADEITFLKDIITGTNEIGAHTALAYVTEWGTQAVADYQAITFKLDKDLATKSTYIATTNNSSPSINTYGVTFSGPTFTIIQSPSYKGTISGFTPGHTLDLAGIGTATSATLSGTVLTVKGGSAGTVSLKLAAGQNYTGDKFVVAPDGNGGTNVTIQQPPPAGETLAPQANVTITPGQQIVGLDYGLWVPDGGATITTYGTIYGVQGVGIEIEGNGTITNGGPITGLIGVIISAVGSLLNNGTVTGTDGNAVLIGDGGNVTNDAGQSIVGTSGGVIITSATGKILNSGTIEASAASGIGAELGAGGTLSNLTTASTIQGGEYGFWSPDGPATVSNLGTIVGTNDVGIDIGQAGTVTNQGSVGGANGIDIAGAGSLSNAATITATDGNAVLIGDGGSVTNDAGQSIVGTSGGVIITSATGKILNSGAIDASAASGIGTELGAGGTLGNLTTASTIQGGEYGVWSPDGPATVSNLGTIVGTNDVGIEIGQAGTVTNQGFIGGANGIDIAGAGSLMNESAITATDGNAVLIGDGGNVTNDAGQSIDGTSGGVLITSAAGSIDNSGTIEANAASGIGTELGAGGALGNLTTASTIRGGEYGVWSPDGPATVSNLGTIVGTNDVGIDIGQAGTVTNEGSIGGANGIDIAGAGSLNNAATITATDGNAVLIGDGGNVTNDAGQSIVGTSGGVIITSATGKILNSGAIEASAASGIGAELGAGGTLSNLTTASTIQGGEYGFWSPDGPATVSNLGTIVGTHDVGIEIGQAGTVTNQGSIGGANGIDIAGAGSLSNAATITATDGNAVLIGDGGSVTNDAGQSIDGTSGGVLITSAAGSIDNSGTIDASSASGIGAELGDGGTLGNLTASSLIEGGEYGVWVPDGAATVTIAGTVEGSTGVEMGGSGSTLTVSGTVIGTGGIAVDLAPGDTLVNDGATFVGKVIDPAASDTLELAVTTAGQNSTLGSGLVGFGAMQVDTGADWTLTGQTTVANVLNDGTLTLAGGSELDVSGASGTGVFQLDANSILSLTDAAGSRAQMQFLGGGELSLGSLAAAGQAPLIEGFGSGDTIDLTGIAATGLDLDYSATTGLLQIEHGTTLAATLSFAVGSLGTGTFHMTTDQHGGTLLTHL